MEINDVQDKSLIMRRTKLSQLVSIGVDKVSVSKEGTEFLTKTMELMKTIRNMNLSRFGQKGMGRIFFISKKEGHYWGVNTLEQKDVESI